MASVQGKDLLALVVTVAWLLVGAYGGAAGWVRVEADQTIEGQMGQDLQAGPVQCDGVQFATLLDCLQYEKTKQSETLFPWVFAVPSFFGLLLMAAGFGAVGSAGRLAREVADGQGSLLGALARPLSAAVTGVLVIGVMLLVPTLLIDTGDSLRPTAMLFLALLAGFFTTEVNEWLKKQLDKVFK